MTAPKSPRLLRHRIAGLVLFCGVVLLVATFIVARMFLSSAATRAVVKDFVTTLNQQRGVAQKAIAASRVSDPLGGTNIENSGEIERRLDLLQKAAAANRAAIESGDQSPAELIARLKRARASSLEISRWQKRFGEQYDWVGSRPVYAARQRVVELQIAMLNFLRNHRDAWGILDAKEGVHFFSRDRRREFDSLLQEYANAIIEEQQAVGKSGASK